MIQIEGIATISKGMFRFDSGLPSDEPAVEPQTLLGRLHIAANASADFHQDGRITNLPPDISTVADGDGYKIKRTTQNYIIQLKVPIAESRAETEQRLGQMLAEVMGEITLDRHEIDPLRPTRGHLPLNGEGWLVSA